MKSVIQNLEQYVKMLEDEAGKLAYKHSDLQQRWEYLLKEIAHNTENLAQHKQALETLKGADAIQE